MRVFRCTDDKSTWDGKPCGCWYREQATGSWEYCYRGDASPWSRTDRDWRPIPQHSIAEIEDFGHHLQQVHDE